MIGGEGMWTWVGGALGADCTGLARRRENRTKTGPRRGHCEGWKAFQVAGWWVFGGVVGRYKKNVNWVEVEVEALKLWNFAS